ncbi:MAG: site-specific integrase [Planctomycetes bacterium]|nr:site-specific integrase [Planctomycetota bacterium]
MSDVQRERLEKLGRERRLIYMTLVLTGLRRGELEALRWRDVDLSDCWLTVPAGKAKNRKAEPLPLRADLVTELKEWHTESGKVDGSVKVFRVPTELVKILDRDLKLDRYPKVDEDGRTIDVHAMRHTTATFLQRGGVAPKTAQRLMRHSDTGGG